jgi:1,4-alpha-glucan branching enzyme
MQLQESITRMKSSMMGKSRSAAVQEVEFSLFAPEAKKVSIAGTFNAWDTNATAMKRSKDGTWKVKVKLAPGRYEYKYFADNAWVLDVAGASLTPNDFGTNNCVIGIE